MTVMKEENFMFSDPKRKRHTMHGKHQEVRRWWGMKGKHGQEPSLWFPRAR
jgi:hypothetical protein